MPYLAFNLNDGNEFVFDILEERLSIGRDVKNDIVIDNTYISGFHAEFIRQADGVYELVDLKSSNGTFVNGKRIDRGRVKGGDKIRFGQLDSRFRERPPKGTAPSAEVKTPAPVKGQPARLDGRRGDTESVPARDAEPKTDTSPIEPTRTPLPRSDPGSKGPTGMVAQTAPIQRPAVPDPALLKQAEELRQEVEKLKQERELLRIENENEGRRREEVRALEKQIEEHQNTMTGVQTKLSGLQAALSSSEKDVSTLDVKRREAANLESQLESTRSQLTKAQTDIAMATKSLQALHAEADKTNADRSSQLQEKEAAASELAALRRQISEAEEKSQDAEKQGAESHLSDSETRSSRSAEVQTLELQLGSRKMEHAALQAAVETLREEETRRSANIENLKAKEADLAQVSRALGEMDGKRSLLEATLAGLMGSHTTAEAKLADLEKQCTEASARLRDLSTERAQAASDQQALTVTKLQLETQLNELRRHGDHLRNSHQKAEEEAARKLSAIEEQVRIRSEELQGLQGREADLSNKLDSLSTTDTDLSSAHETLKAVESRKADLTAAIAQMTQEHDALARSLAAAAEKGRAQHGLTQTLTVRREVVEREVRGAEAQKETVMADLALARENVRLAETTLSDRQEETKAAIERTGQLATKAAELAEQHSALQKEMVLLTEQIGAAKAELEQATREAAVQKEAAQTAAETEQRHSAKAAGLQEQITALEALTATLAATQKERQQEISEAEQKLTGLQGQVEETTSRLTSVQTALTEQNELLATAKAELERVTADAKAKQEAAREAAEAQETSRSQTQSFTEKIVGLQTLLATLANTQTDRQHQVSVLEAEQRNLTDQLAARQKEIAGAEARAGELQAQITTHHGRLAELAGTEKKLADTQASLVLAVQELDKTQAENQRLQAEKGEHEKRVPALRLEAEKLQAEVAGKLKDLVAGESRVAALSQQTADLENRVKELAEVQKKLAETRAALDEATSEHSKVNVLLPPLVRLRQEHEQVLPGLKSEIEGLRAELATLMRDKQATAGALEKAQNDRKLAFEQTEALRLEAANLNKLLTDKRSQLESETQAKLAEASAAESRLRELEAKVAAGEKRTAELSEVDRRLANAVSGVREAEKQRLTEEKALADLARQQENLRKDLTRSETESKVLTAHVAELGKKARTEEARAADAETRLQKATAAAQAVEAKRLEAEAVATRAREEEKLLRKQIPALNTELAALQVMLVSLTKEREEASQFVTRLNVATESSNKKVAELHQQISQLEEAHRLREERLMKAQEEVDKEAGRLKTAQEATRNAEQTLMDLEKEVKEQRQRTETARAQAGGLEMELGTRLDRVEKLKLEEARLIKELEAQKLDVEGTSAAFAELQHKVRHEEGRLAEFLHMGGKILPLGAALSALESRQSEAAKSLRDASERELALQVKINSLQESLNRESARAEQVKKERANLEAELVTFTSHAEKQAAALQSQENEQRKRLANVENALRDQSLSLDRVRSEVTALNDRRAEFAQAEAQLHHWKEIEERLRGQLLELEEKHEILRRGLPTEEATVVMFANDIIKRIDLIDALSSRYAGHNGGDVVAQLRTLRHSFEDILFQHGVSEFDINAGTEVDVELRKRITVVESVPGKNKPRVVETCRSGFIYSREEGHEFVLRKVEVRTSSH